MELLKKFEELSLLARETSGAAFVIQHEKETGKFKVVFSSFLSSSKELLKPKELPLTIDEAIAWLKSNRKEVDVPQKFTLF